jgi:hypothetical protein
MDAFIQYIDRFEISIKVLITLAALVLIWAFFYFKSQSPYIILDKVWSLFVGSKGFNNKKLDAFHKDRHDLDKFNSLYNFNATNTEQIEKFVEWVKLEKCDTRKISSIKGWFDLETLKPVKPEVWESWTLAILAIILFVITLMSGFFGLTQNAIVKLNENDPWFLINHSRAKPVFNKFMISKADCTNPSYNRDMYSDATGITKPSVNSICDAFEKKTEMDAVDKLIKLQSVGMYFSFMFFMCLLSTLKNLLRRMNAYDYISRENRIKNSC